MILIGLKKILLIYLGTVFGVVGLRVLGDLLGGLLVSLSNYRNRKKISKYQWLSEFDLKQPTDNISFDNVFKYAEIHNIPNNYKDVDFDEEPTVVKETKSINQADSNDVQTKIVATNIYPNEQNSAKKLVKAKKR